MTVLTTPTQIEGARLLTLRAMLKLEMLGMTRSKGQTAYAMLKAMGYKGSRAEVLAQMDEVRNSLINAKVIA
jgi:uncharacterized protein YjfI (DUF2170 family)